MGWDNSVVTVMVTSRPAPSVCTVKVTTVLPAPAPDEESDASTPTMALLAASKVNVTACPLEVMV
ncbi:hypothetical protein GCM10007086_24430 [Photobacterium aphoticum]|nr:hypothetical protein GCM10007086_24430 [Photobacterium aphoticum]